MPMWFVRNSDLEMQFRLLKIHSRVKVSKITFTIILEKLRQPSIFSVPLETARIDSLKKVL